MPLRSAAAREREVYRYYQPDEEKAKINPDGSRVPQASSDPILTAFAQLGALRMNTKRGIITLSTSTAEFMLAESGKALSLQKDDDEHDQLWHGVGVFNKCPDQKAMVINDLTKHEELKTQWVVLNKPFVRFIAAVPLRSPGSGMVIGSYLVADDQVREGGLTECEMEFMLDMGATVMDYLEAGLIKKKQYRSERMIKAVSLFIEGKSSIRDWWLERGHRLQQPSVMQRTRSAIELDKLADAEFGIQEPASNLSRGLSNLQDEGHGGSLARALGNWHDDELSSMPQTPSSVSGMSVGKADSTTGRPAFPRAESHMSSDSATQSTLVSKSYIDRNSSVTTMDTLVDPGGEGKDNRASVSFDLPPVQLNGDSSLPKGSHLPKELQDALLSTELRAVFSRASNLIREAIGVQGVVFYDASVGSVGVGSEHIVIGEKAPGPFQTEHAPTSSEDEAGRRLSVAHADVNGHSDSAMPSDREPEKSCHVLGFSTRKRSSLRGHRASDECGTLPENIMRRLLKRYPHGKIFNFGPDGTYCSSDSDNCTTPGIDPTAAHGRKAINDEAQSSRKKYSKESEAKAILKCLPGARSVFWFPLWDQTRERWFSGCLIWSNSPTRVMCPTEDLTYLAAFGNSTMAEVARISAQVLDKMKSDFISSISHELRSPLHGVLASVEFLQETEMTDIQEDMVNNIHASGKVLLDTINHVLDFSKVNRRSKNNTSLSKSARRRKKKGIVEKATVEEEEDQTDILKLTEEVIESIYAGHSVGKPVLSPNSHRSSFIATKEYAVNVVTDIKWEPNWTFEIDPGAWSRILMNIFSNALKYTKSGFVKVSLELEDEGVARSKKSRKTMVLKVRDSGKGISEEFLKYRLFKPFTQEDSLATGTGLGLSIVRHIIQDLGGTINFTSEQGTGTEVTVRLPLRAQKPAAISPEDEMLLEVRNITKGYTFRLEGFDRYPDIAEAPTGILSAEAEAAMLLKSAGQSKLVDWFCMEPSQPTDEYGADIIVIMEAGVPPNGVEEILNAYDHSKPSKSGKAIAIVMCSGYRPTPKMLNCGRFQIFYLHQPQVSSYSLLGPLLMSCRYGPHKCAKVLHSAFCEKKPSIIPESASQRRTSNSETPGLAGTGNFHIASEPASESQKTNGAAPKLASTINYDPPEKKHIDLPNGTDKKDFGPDITDLLSPKAHVFPAKQKKLEPVRELNPPGPNEKQMRVLLVEDNEINLKLLVATMRKLKIIHTTAMNGLEALNAYKDCRGQFDVVFMDISMPVMSGIDSARYIRRFERDEKLAATKLIALTGAANPTTRQEAFNVGVDLYLTKPVPMRELRSMLEEIKKESAFDVEVK
ncbi:CheY-like protein [Glarea lozoyensis ATCC 20868]|uniref:CheY-like protein n=1 Tax=Glarea lozoyensis (strain ATCC 20868 / MF5171) TaxID=1116229 RepID=S3E004_GLAL2|nr:CheY-like protein [Glarea lozoyensis ATCC 20868]EPE31883.1 CheY-like protein [Glarea lozoyensis ATCC 20868]